MAEYDVILRDATITLFAEEFVHYVMLQKLYVEILPFRVERYRPFIRKEFTETTKRVIHFFDETMEIYHIFKNMLANNSVNKYMYRKYAQELRDVFFSKGFDALKFLYYCTNLATLAAYFYSCEVREAHTFAIAYITNVLEEFVINTDVFGTLRRTAERIVHMAPDLYGLIPAESSVAVDTAKHIYVNEPEGSHKNVIN